VAHLVAMAVGVDLLEHRVYSFDILLVDAASYFFVSQYKPSENHLQRDKRQSSLPPRMVFIFFLMRMKPIAARDSMSISSRRTILMLEIIMPCICLYVMEVSW
jgi:hypothetical protein